jgi:hypothetical protein
LVGQTTTGIELLLTSSEHKILTAVTATKGDVVVQGELPSLLAENGGKDTGVCFLWTTWMGTEHLITVLRREAKHTHYQKNAGEHVQPCLREQYNIL